MTKLRAMFENSRVCCVGGERGRGLFGIVVHSLLCIMAILRARRHYVPMHFQYKHSDCRNVKLQLQTLSVEGT